MSTQQRRLRVLRAIVVEHVQTKEPVASKAVAQTHVKGVSSATIRNDMGVLEEQGLIRQPHTSAGRVPTEAGYRVFVDGLDAASEQVARTRRLIAQQVDPLDSVEDAIERTVRVLARITGQAAVAEYPDLIADRIRRIELIDLNGDRALVIVVTKAGRVFERQVPIPEDLTGTSDDVWGMLQRIVNEAAVDLGPENVKSALGESEPALPAEQKPLFDLVCEAVVASLQSLETSRLVTAGAANLARAGLDFQDVANVLDVLEDPQALLRELHNMRVAPVHVAIGAENLHEGLLEASVISAAYASTKDGPPARGETPSSHVGVIGPTRMDYARSLAAVEAVSGYLSRLLLRQSGATDAPTESGEET